jgi:hypothetical protein
MAPELAFAAYAAPAWPVFAAGIAAGAAAVVYGADGGGMSIELGFLWLAEVLMFTALGLFIAAFRVRKTDQARHQRLGKVGALIVFTGLLAVELVARGLDWRFPVRSPEALRVHIWVATAALLVLIALVVTGMRGPRRLHVRLWPIFFPLFVATNVLSLFAFRLW